MVNGLIYLSDYKISEQDFLTAKGIFTFRIADFLKIQEIDLSELKFGRYLMRGPKLKQLQFENIFHHFKKNEVSLFTDISSFAYINNFSNYYGIIKEFSPKSIIFERGVMSSVISENLEREGVRSPVFLRSEVESAAKYVGIEGCIIKQINDSEIDDKVCNLESHVKGFRNLIFKEVVSLKKENDENLEFRCIIVQDKVMLFDDSGIKSRLIPTKEVIAFAQIVAQHNYFCGIRGAYFLDLGVKVDGEIIIIEMKDFINGTIKNFEELVNGLNHL